MKQPTYLHIPEPCHEDWNKMSATQQGRYCKSCCKQVIDFSLMTDPEILAHLTKTSENTCGRFMQDQLLRPLSETRIEHRKGWKWLVASAISLVMINRSEAQQGKPIASSSKSKMVKKDIVQTKGEVQQIVVVGEVDSVADEKYVSPAPIIVQGIIKDDKGMPLSGATIAVNSTTIVAISNSTGEFHFTRNADEFHNTLALTFSSLGCENLHIATVLQEDTVNLQI